ncbi:MAG: hypothetical protein KBT48_06740 [Firmicutes bacterium]|nr:hypothetical protein [Bacillota bacterium]
MVNIRDIKSDENNWFTYGIFDSTSLFHEEMKVMIFTDDGASLEDAYRCIEHYNSLTDQSDLYTQIENMLKPFFLYMYEEWGAMEDVYEEIADSLEPVIEGFKKGEALCSYLYSPTLLVFPQLEGELGYGVEAECPWEPEHMCCILIRNEKVVYVGPSEGNDPWQDEEDYYCIWNEED